MTACPWIQSQRSLQLKLDLVQMHRTVEEVSDNLRKTSGMAARSQEGLAPAQPVLPENAFVVQLHKGGADRHVLECDASYHHCHAYRAITRPSQLERVVARFVCAF